MHFVLGRKVGLLRAQDHAHFQRGVAGIPEPEAHAGVHDEVLARTLGQDDLLAARAEDLEAGIDQHLLGA